MREQAYPTLTFMESGSLQHGDEASAEHCCVKSTHKTSSEANSMTLNVSVYLHVPVIAQLSIPYLGSLYPPARSSPIATQYPVKKSPWEKNR
jgi:hypothetical protein